MFEVTALEKGFYGKLQKKGDTFKVASEKAIGSWMKLTENGKKSLAKVKAEEAEAEKAKAKVKAK